LFLIPSDRISNFRRAIASAIMTSRIMKSTPSNRNPPLAPIRLVPIFDLETVLIIGEAATSACCDTEYPYLDGYRIDFDYAIAPVDHITFRSDENVISLEQEDLFLAGLLSRVTVRNPG